MRENLSRVNARANPAPGTVADVVVLRESRRVGQHEWRRAIRSQMNSPTTFAVAQALVSYTNRDGSNAHPGNERLAADLGCTTKTIQRALKWLRDEGWLRLDQPANMPDRGRKLAQEWSLTVPEQWTSQTPTGDTGVHPPDPDLHHSASVSPPRSTTVARKDDKLDYLHDDFDMDYAEEWISDQVDGFSGYELTMVDNMLAGGVHPHVIARKVLAERQR